MINNLNDFEIYTSKYCVNWVGRARFQQHQLLANLRASYVLSLFIPLETMWALLSLIVLVSLPSINCGIVNLLLESAVGTPTLHNKVNWKFDPEMASRLNRDFEEEHGHHSAILIEKLGLGIDGQRIERLQQQQLRDQNVIITGYNSPSET